MYFNFKRIKRGRINETIINKYFNDISHDIMDQYNKLDELKENINILKNTVSNNITIANKLNENVSELINNIDTNSNVSIYTNTLYSSKDVFIPNGINSTLQASIDTEFGVATCGISSSIRALTGITDNKVIITPTARNHINRIIGNNSYDTKADEIIENDILNAIDPQSNIPYLLIVKTTDNSINQASMIISIDNIDFPSNTIKIKPLPLLDQQINNISLNTSSGTIQLQDIIENNITFPIQNANNILFTFGELNINSFTVNIINNNKSATIPYTFILGISDISLEYNEYYNKSYVGFKFIVPKDTNNQYKKIKQISFNWTYKNNITKAYIYKGEISANNITNDYLDIITTDGKIYDTPLQINEDYVYIIVELNKLPNNSSPYVKSCSIKFV